MVSDDFREEVRSILAAELDKGAMVTIANGLIDDLHCLKTAMIRDDRRSLGDVLESLDQRSRILRDKLNQANDI